MFEAAKPAEEIAKPVKERRRRSSAQKKTTPSDGVKADEAANLADKLAIPSPEEAKPAGAIPAEEAAKTASGKDKTRRMPVAEKAETVDISGDDDQFTTRVRTRTRRHRAPIEDV